MGVRRGEGGRRGGAVFDLSPRSANSILMRVALWEPLAYTFLMPCSMPPQPCSPQDHCEKRQYLVFAWYCFEPCLWSLSNLLCQWTNSDIEKGMGGGGRMLVFIERLSKNGESKGYIKKNCVDSTWHLGVIGCLRNSTEAWIDVSIWVACERVGKLEKGRLRLSENDALLDGSHSAFHLYFGHIQQSEWYPVFGRGGWSCILHSFADFG